MGKSVITFLELYRYALLAAIAAAGFFARVRRFRAKGLFLWDEAAYFREVFVWNGIRAFFRRHGPELRRNPGVERRKELAKEFWDEAIASYAYYKPLHLYLNALCIRVFGRRDYAVAVPSLVMGTATIALVYFAGALVFSPAAGLAAAAMLAVSGLHTLHSRSAEPEPGTAFCFTAAALAMITFGQGFSTSGQAVLPFERILIQGAAAGVCLGGVLLFNPAWALLIPGIFVCSLIVFAAASGAWAAAAAFCAAALAAALIAIVITDIPFIIMHRLLPELKLPPHTLKFVEILKEQVQMVFARLKGGEAAGDMGVTLPRWYRFAFYPDLLRRSEGALFLIAAAGGIFVLFLKPAPAALMIGAQAAIAAAGLTLVPQKAARGVVFILPLLCVFAGAAVSALPPWAAAAALALMAFSGAVRVWRIGSFTSAMRRASDFAAAQNSGAFISTDTPFMIVYEDRTPVFPKFYNILYTMHFNENIRYLIVDHHVNYPTLLWDDTVDLIEEYFEPVFTAEDPCITYYPLLAEVEYYSEKAFFTGSTIDVARWNRFRLSPSEKDKRIRVYDLKEFFENENKPGLAGQLQRIKGAYLYDQKQYKDALALLRLAQREYPDDPEIKYYIGLCHLRGDKPQWTLKLFREIMDNPALKTDFRKDCRVFVLVEDAIKLLWDKKHEQALPLFEEALELSPEHHTARLHYAISLRAIGRIEDAAAQVKIILNNNPSEQAREACEVFLDKMKPQSEEMRDT